MVIAVVGHNVEPWLTVAAEQAMAAAEPGDRVVFLDSASTDGSAARARRLGLEVLAAPLGKGRAVATLLARTGRAPVCLIDGDLEGCSVNIPRTLRDTWRASDAAMVIGTFAWPARRELSISDHIHDRLAAFLFPEYSIRAGLRPLSGQRLLRGGLELGSLPAGYGLEAHLNLHVSATGGQVEWADLGLYQGPVIRRDRGMPMEIGRAILDLAQAHGRLSAHERPAWEAWLDPVASVFDAVPPEAEDLSEYRTRLAAAASRALPGEAQRADAVRPEG